MIKDIYQCLAPAPEKPRKPSVLITAKDPGAANCLKFVARDLSRHGTPVFFNTADRANEIISAQFPELLFVTGLPSDLRWTISALESDVAFSVRATQAGRDANSNSKIALVEDYPGLGKKTIEGLTATNFTPDLILTPTRRQATLYQQSFQNSETLVIPIGQPSFDYLLEEDTTEASEKARGKLGIPNNTFVVSYLGQPSTDARMVETDSTPMDLYSYGLTEIAKALKAIAKERPKERFVLINRPHPREIEELWNNPFLKNMEETSPDNLSFVSHSKDEWSALPLTTRDTEAASDLVITMTSTAGLEVAVSGSRQGLTTRRGSTAMHLLIGGSALQDIMPDNLSVVDMGATGVAVSTSETAAEIERCLFDYDYLQKIEKAQGLLNYEYRFNKGATGRVRLWMRAYEEYGVKVDQALNILTSK